MYHYFTLQIRKLRHSEIKWFLPSHKFNKWGGFPIPHSGLFLMHYKWTRWKQNLHHIYIFLNKYECSLTAWVKTLVLPFTSFGNFAGFSVFLNHSIHFCKIGIISSVLKVTNFRNIYWVMIMFQILSAENSQLIKSANVWRWCIPHCLRNSFNFWGRKGRIWIYTKHLGQKLERKISVTKISS